MITTTIIVLPVAVISLSILKYANSLQKPVNVPLTDNTQPVSFDDMSESSRHYIIQDYHATDCFPTTKGSYSIRTKRHLLNEDYLGNNTTDRILQSDLQQEQESRLPSEIDGAEFSSQNNDHSLNNSTFTNTTLETSSKQEGNNSTTGLKTLYNTDISMKKSEINDGEIKSHDARNNDMDNNIKKVAELIRGFTDTWNRTLSQKDITVSKDLSNYQAILNNSLLLEKSIWRHKGDKEATREAQARLMKLYMDNQSDPCQDFYQYACGNWNNLNPIPKDKANFDTFEKLRESLDVILKELLEENISDDEIAAHVKAKQFYRSCVNYEILEQRGISPLTDLLNALGGWPIITPKWNSSSFSWIQLMAHLRLYNNDILISEWVGADIKNSDEYVIQFDQTSLGLPTRDYYLQSSNKIYIDAYKEYLIKIAKLLGATAELANTQAEELIEFETALAKITAPSDERRDVSGLYQRTTVGNLRVLIPEVNWQQYLSIVLNKTCEDNQPVVIFAMRYVKELVLLIDKTSPRIVANYLLWRFVRNRVNNLDDRFQEAKQQFYYVLAGREKTPPRWKSCILQVNTNMGMAVGAMFVQKYFDENSKNDTLSMTKDIQQSFNEILQMTNWLGRKTRRLASEKVNKMMLKVGYPDFILSSEQLNDRYKDVIIDPDKYFENTLNLLQHVTMIEQSHLGTAVNKSIWNTAPAVVNAYYSRNKNQIMFPAGILQPPFYHKHFPRSLNFGGIGVVIGHEITHGFDDKGRLFDKFGNLHRWWKDDEIRNFHDKAHCLIEQYGKYVVQEVGISLDGVNTQGENIADNGGIKQAYKAYQDWLKSHGDSDETLPGLNATASQLFFLNFAQVWCGNTRPEAFKNGLKTAVHSPGRFRVIGTLSNNEDFARTYQCPVGSPMNPVNKCSVW